MHEEYGKVSGLLEYDESRSSLLFFACGCGGGSEEAALRRMQAAVDTASKEYEDAHALEASVNSG